MYIARFVNLATLQVIHFLSVVCQSGSSVCSQNTNVAAAASLCCKGLFSGKEQILFLNITHEVVALAWVAKEAIRLVRLSGRLLTHHINGRRHFPKILSDSVVFTKTDGLRCSWALSDPHST